MRMSFAGGSVVKNLPDHTGDAGLIPGSGGSPGGGNDNTLQHFHQESHGCGQRSLVGYCPWDHKELDTTVQLSTHISENRSNLSGPKQ